MASLIFMPARGELSAPTFDKTNPRELPRYFNDLEYLFVQASVTDDKKKKWHTLRYIDFDFEFLWKAIPEYSDNTTTYTEFKNVILGFYPEATDSVYSRSDLDKLISDRLQLGITSTADLSDFHLQFSALTSRLIDNGLLDEIEQRWTYTRAFQPQFLATIHNRLQLKHCDHHPSFLYQINDVYDAALFILRSPLSAPQISSVSPASSISTSTTTTSVPEIEHKELTALFSEFTKTIINTLQETNCACSPTCPDTSLKHSRDQSQLTTTSPHYTIREDNSPAQQSKNDRTSVDAVQSSSHLSKKDRIAALEAEIFALRTRKAHTAQNRTQQPQETYIRFSDQVQVIPTTVTNNTTPVRPRQADTVHISTSQPDFGLEQLFSEGTIIDDQRPTQQEIAALFVTSKPTMHSHSISQPIYEVFESKIAAEVPQVLVEKPTTYLQRELPSTAPETPFKPRLDTRSPRPSHQDSSPAAQTKYQTSNRDLKLDYLPLVPETTKPHETRQMSLDISKEEYLIAETVPLRSKNLSFLVSASDSIPASTLAFTPSSASPEVLRPLRATSYSFSSTKSPLFPLDLTIPTVSKVIAPPSSTSISPPPTPSSASPEILQSPRAPLDSSKPFPSTISLSDIAVQTVSNIVIPNSPISSPATSFLISQVTNNLETPEPIMPRIRHLSAFISTDYTSPNVPSLCQNQTAQFQPPASTFIIYNFVPPLLRLTT